MKFLIAFFVPLIIHATHYKFENCGPDFFSSHYLQLANEERALAEAYNKIALYSGSTRIDHCIVESPYDGSKSIDGIRRVMFDASWYKIVKVNGREIREKEHHGLLVEYERTGSQRKVISLIVCRTPESCKREGIPYRFLITK